MEYFDLISGFDKNYFYFFLLQIQWLPQSLLIFLKIIIVKVLQNICAIPVKHCVCWSCWCYTAYGHLLTIDLWFLGLYLNCVAYQCSSPVALHGIDVSHTGLSRRQVPAAVMRAGHHTPSANACKNEPVTCRVSSCCNSIVTRFTSSHVGTNNVVRPLFYDATSSPAEPYWDTFFWYEEKSPGVTNEKENIKHSRCYV